MLFPHTLTAGGASPLVGEGREGGPPPADPHTTRHPCNAAT
jgi:hypothetical protein